MISSELSLPPARDHGDSPAAAAAACDGMPTKSSSPAPTVWPQRLIQPGLPALLLAPMDGVTDHLMRAVLSAAAPFTGCVTEFIRVSAAVPPDHVLLRTVPELSAGACTPAGLPVVAQLLGGDPERLAATAVRLVELGAQAIDLNFGCPAPTVNRHDGGATLLRFPERIEAIVRAVRTAVPARVSVSAKLRLGWDDPSAIYENAARAARGGADWLTIHGRTRMQGYTPPAFWEPIGRVRAQLDIPVIANGEIWSVEDLARCQEQSGAVHFMLGRGVLAEPGLARQCAAWLGLPPSAPAQVHYTAPCGSDAEQWRGLLQRLVRCAAELPHSSARQVLARCKQWLNYAHKRGNAPWFDLVKRTGSVEELFEALGTAALCGEPVVGRASRC